MYASNNTWYCDVLMFFDVYALELLHFETLMFRNYNVQWWYVNRHKRCVMLRFFAVPFICITWFPCSTKKYVIRTTYSHLWAESSILLCRVWCWQESRNPLDMSSFSHSQETRQGALSYRGKWKRFKSIKRQLMVSSVSGLLRNEGK
jgi:hypothetical protein